MNQIIRHALFLPFLLMAISIEGYSFEKRDDGIVLKPGNQVETGVRRLIIRAITGDMIRITGFPGEGGSAPASLVVDSSHQWPQTTVTVREQQGTIHMMTKTLTILIDEQTGAITIKNKRDEILFQEGTRKIVPGVILDEPVHHVRQSFQWADDEALYGLGQHQEGVFNWRGHDAELVQYNMRAVVPFLLSSKGYGLLWDNTSYTRFSDTPAGSWLWSEVGDCIDYYFIYGPDPDSVIRNYRRLTGAAPLFPRWAYGYVQSKERYKTQQEILDVAREYRDRRIPMDVIVLDWQYWDNGHWGQKSFNRERFPDPASMMQTLHDQYHTRLMISVWPKMSVRSADYREMAEHEGFLYPDEDSPFYDAFNPDARALYWNQANEGLFSKGIDAWWCDATEPELDGWDFNIDAYKTKMKPAIGSGARYMNAYSLMHARGIYENQRKTTGNKRVVNLTRSAFAGQQRYATITWSGDIVATWDVFRRQIPAGLNFCMSGLPYWTTDIGGFFVHSAEKGKLGQGLWFRNGGFDGGTGDDDYKELYVRWFQYGAFCPVFRSHGTDISREIWRFGEPGHWAYDALLKFDRLRYRLMPYIYSTAWHVTADGYTPMRGLVMDFMQDPHVLDIGDQFMFGPALLISPVTRPKSLFRHVYLPQGAGWINFWTGKKYSGGQTLSVPTPVGEIPVYVRAGSIVPMGPVIQYAAEAADPIELRIYPGADGRFVLYEDENDNYNYEKGACSVIEFGWNDLKRELVIEDRKGEFPGMLAERQIQVVLVRENHGNGADMVRDPDRVIRYEGKRQAVMF
ncbi:DUF5110 domain-containing protein [bacterium]|nr:DUF5110 domain-containing protein [bacterium]